MTAEKQSVDAISAQLVELRRDGRGVARVTEHVPAPLVGVEYDYVREPACRHRCNLLSG